MKLNFITSKTLFEATKAAIGQIDYKNLDERNIVVVPDAFSMQAENLIFDVLNIKSTFNISVVGISRLASKLLRENNIMFDRVSGLEEILLTYKAIKDNEENFLYFKNYGVDFAKKVLEILKTFSNSGLKPEDISNCDDRILSFKMHDLKLIYSAYLNLLEDRLNLTKLLEFFLDKISGIENCNLYFVNFDSFSNEIFDFICKLSQKVKSVTIATAKATGQANSYIYDTETQDKMFEFAKNSGLAITTTQVTPKLLGDKKAVLDAAFAIKGEKQPCKSFLNVEAVDQDDEIDFISKYIRHRVICEGARYRDFALATASQDYFEKLKHTLSKYDIPFYMDYTLSLNEVAFAKFLIKTMEIAQAGFTKSDIEYLLSSPFLNVADGEKLIKLVEYYDIDDIADFKKKDKSLDEICLTIDSFRRGKTIKDFCQSAINIIEIAQRNLDFYLEKISFDLQKQSENKQSVDTAKKIFEEISSFKYDETITLKDFIFLVQTIFNSIKIETVPSYIDAVYVGEVTTSYFQDVDTLIIAGASADSLPKTDKDSGLLVDADIAKLKYKNAIEPETRIKNRRNRLKLFEVLQHFNNKLIVLTPLSQDRKKASFVEDMIKSFGGDCVVSTKSYAMFDRADLDRQGKIDLLLFNLGSRRVAGENFKKIDEKLPADFSGSVRSYIGEELFSYNYGEPLKNNPLKDKISASQLETYFNCPFKHYVTYLLKVRELETAKEDKRKVGTFKHELVKDFVELYKTNLKKVTEKEIKEFLDKNFYITCKKCFDEVVLDNYIFMKLLREECSVLLANIVYENTNSGFTPTALEDFISSSIGGLKFVGRVDRLDEYKQYFRIIDYKTGEVGNVLKDLYYGKKLQLFLYAKVESKKLKKECAGVYYFDSKNKFKKKNEFSKILNGVTLKDDEVVEATDIRSKNSNARSDIAGALKLKQPKDDFSYRYIPVINSLEKCFDYATKVSENAIKEIKEGYILPKPLDGVCEYCPYISVCKFNKESARKEGKTIF